MKKNINTESELLEALEYADNKVVALVGSWGVGKSHLWDDLRKKESVKLSRLKPTYAYVSLFGLKTADEIRSAIFSQFISIDAKDSTKGDLLKNGLAPYVDNIKAGVAKMEGIWKIAADGFGAAFEVLKIHGVSNSLICFDDFERAGDGLDASQLLGIINDLTSRHKCKVLLILNDSKLTEKNRAVLNEYRERVIDKEIRYEPSYQHVLGIAIPELSLRVLVEPHVKQLGTTNIRIIRRMRATIDEVRSKTGRPIDQTAPGVISAICLLTYCHLMQGTNGIPAVADVAKVDYVERATDDGVVDVASEFLRGQNWFGVDECDRLIGDLVAQGIVDWTALTAQITKHQADITRESKKQEWRELWHGWHQRFLNEAASTAYIARIVETTKRIIDIVDAREIDDISDLMEKLKLPALGMELLDAWKLHNKGNASAHSIRDAEHFCKLKSDAFREYLKAQAGKADSPAKGIAEILANLHTSQSWGGEDYRYLVSASSAEYAQSFREYGEVDLSLKGWIDIVNSEPSDADKETILASGKAALLQLATESASNAIFAQSALRQVRAQPPAARPATG